MRGSLCETTPKASTTLDDSPKIKSSLTVRKRNFQKCTEVELQDGGRVRCGDHLPPHRYIRNTSTRGTAPTGHLLNTGRRPQTSQKARKSPTYLGRAKEKRKNRDKRIGTGPAPVGRDLRQLWRRKGFHTLGAPSRAETAGGRGGSFGAKEESAANRGAEGKAERFPHGGSAPSSTHQPKRLVCSPAGVGGAGSWGLGFGRLAGRGLGLAAWTQPEGVSAPQLAGRESGKRSGAAEEARDFFLPLCFLVREERGFRAPPKRTPEKGASRGSQRGPQRRAWDAKAAAAATKKPVCKHRSLSTPPLPGACAACHCQGPVIQGQLPRENARHASGCCNVTMPLPPQARPASSVPLPPPGLSEPESPKQLLL